MSLLSLYDDKDLSIVVACPSPGVWLQEFGISLVGMFTACTTHRIGKARRQELKLCAAKGSMLVRMRMEAVEYALQEKADYILFADTDHGFPRSALHRLISHGKDVVAVNCVTKCIPAMTTARVKSPDQIGGEPVISIGKTGLEKVWRVGTGMMLVHMGVFRNIGSKCFDMYWREDVKQVQGEDWSMCEAMEKAGYDIWVDHDLSLEVTHVGYMAYTHSMTLEGFSTGAVHGQG